MRSEEPKLRIFDLLQPRKTLNTQRSTLNTQKILATCDYL